MLTYYLVPISFLESKKKYFTKLLQGCNQQHFCSKCWQTHTQIPKSTSNAKSWENLCKWQIKKEVVCSHDQKFCLWCFLSLSNILLTIPTFFKIDIPPHQILNLTLTHIFSWNQIVHKISFSLCFWASDPLMNFTKIYWIKVLKPEKSYEKFDLTKKYV